MSCKSEAHCDHPKHASMRGVDVPLPRLQQKRIRLRVLASANPCLGLELCGATEALSDGQVAATDSGEKCLRLCGRLAQLWEKTKSTLSPWGSRREEALYGRIILWRAGLLPARSKRNTKRDRVSRPTACACFAQHPPTWPRTSLDPSTS